MNLFSNDTAMNLFFNNYKVRGILLMSLASFVVSCAGEKKQAASTIEPTSLDPAAFVSVGCAPFTGEEKQTCLVTLRHPETGIETSVTNYGARVVSLLVPSSQGLTDVVLGFDSIAPYLNVKQNFGAVVGRYIGRILSGHLVIDDQFYQLPVGDNGDTSHGGEPSFSKRIWDVVPGSVSDTTVTLRYVSIDMENGFPGTLDLSVTYALEPHGLRIDYRATTDKATVLNPSNHSFFNLSGDLSRDVMDHQLTIASDSIAEYNEVKRVTGRLLAVEGTPIDFRQPHVIGERIDEDNAQLAVTKGYDHCYQMDCTEPLHFAASLYAPATGLTMQVFTTEPAMQIYTANGHKGNIIGKEGKAYPRRNAICFETMHYPDSPNQPQWPSTLLRPGETFRSTTRFDFSSSLQQ